MLGIYNWFARILLGMSREATKGIQMTSMLYHLAIIID